MSSSFFLSNPSSGKRKYEGKNQGKSKVKKKFDVGSKHKNKEKHHSSKGNFNEEILSDASDVEGKHNDENKDYTGSDGVHSNDSDEETTEEKRLRLAKKYLEEIERQEKERIGDLSEHQSQKGTDIEGGLESAINSRLRRDDLEESGMLTQTVAHNYENLESNQLVDVPNIQLLRDHKVHKSSITCIVASSDGQYVLSGSKDGGVVLWGMEVENKNIKISSNLNGSDLEINDSKESEDSSVCSDNLSFIKLARVVGGRKGCEDKHIGHCTSVNCVAISSDSKFLVSGDDSNLIMIWKINATNNKKETPKDLNSGLERIHVFRGHRSPVSGLAFRIGTHTLYSCSHDRSVKVWNLDEMAYVETLFGHQDRISGIDAGIRERVLTSGGRDGTVRIWKIVEESQLVFNAPAVTSERTKDSYKNSGVVGSASVDSIKLLDEQHFLTCGEDGHVSLWNVMRKKPVCTIARAHGSDPTNNDPRWISAIGTLHNTDLVASGSSDGVIKLWKCTEKFRSLVEIASLPISNFMSEIKTDTNSDATSTWSAGFANGVCFHPSGRALLVGIGQEHRLGRWWRIKEARNGILVLPLRPIKDSEALK